MSWKLHPRVTLDEIRERLAVDGYPLTLASPVRLAYREGRLLWTTARLTIVGRDAIDLRPDGPLCGSGGSEDGD